MHSLLTKAYWLQGYIVALTFGCGDVLLALQPMSLELKLTSWEQTTHMWTEREVALFDKITFAQLDLEATSLKGSAVIEREFMGAW